MKMKSHIANPAVGRVILMKERHFQGRTQLWTISSVDEKQIELERGTGPDKDQTSISRPDLIGVRHQAVWTHAIPSIDEGILSAMLPMLEKSRYTNHCYLFKVGAADENGHRPLNLVNAPKTGRHDAESNAKPLDLWLSSNFKVKTHTDNAMDMDFQPDTGAIILLRPIRTNDSIDKTMIYEGEAVDTTMTHDQAKTMLGKTMGTMRIPAWPIGNENDLDMEIGQCLAKHEEDIVIALILETGSIESPDHSYCSLLVEGSKLYWNDSINDDLWGTSLGHGVWIGNDISWHDNGEDGAEWEANWRRATMLDMIKHGITFEEFLAEFEDLAERKATHNDINVLFANDWDDAVRTIDEHGSPETAGAIAIEWIEGLGQIIKQSTGVEIKQYNLESDGGVITLYKGTTIQATATITRDEANYSVLTRWVCDDMIDHVINDRLNQWKASAEKA